MITYITRFPKENLDEKAYLFPFAASKILSNDYPDVLDLINDSEELLQSLILQFQEEIPHNSTAFEYFSEVCEALLSRDTSFLAVIYQNEFEKYLVGLIANRNLINLVWNIIQKSQKKKKYREKAKILLGTVIDKVFDRDFSENSQGIVCLAVTDQEFYQDVLERIGDFFECLGGNDEIIEKSALKVIKSLLEKEKDLKTANDEFWGSEPIVNCIKNYGLSIKALLEKEKPLIKTTFVLEIVPAGESTILTLEILTLLIDSEHSEILDFLTLHDIFFTSLNIFEKYPWSSFLHTAYISFIDTVLHSSLKFLIVPELANQIIRNTSQSPPNTLLGPCYKLAELLMKTSQNEEIQTILQSIENWGSFLEAFNHHNSIHFTLPNNYH